MQTRDVTAGVHLLTTWREARASAARELRHVHKARCLLRQAGSSDLLLDQMEELRKNVTDNLLNHGFARRVTVADAVIMALEHHRNARGYELRRRAVEEANELSTGNRAQDFHALDQWRDLNRRWARQFLQVARILKGE